MTVVVDEATMTTGLTDPKTLIKKRIADRVQEVCPEIAGVVIR